MEVLFNDPSGERCVDFKSVDNEWLPLSVSCPSFAVKTSQPKPVQELRVPMAAIPSQPDVLALTLVENVVIIDFGVKDVRLVATLLLSLLLLSLDLVWLPIEQRFL